MFFKYRTLHSTMVLFKSAYRLLTPALSSLYIPLWFYSNPRRQTHDGGGPCPLHSTMVLFKLGTPRKASWVKQLYIPLWFYSNKLPLTRWMNLSAFTFHYGSIQMRTRLLITPPPILLYIPLWFYSNRCAWKMKQIFTRFTFHYGSIQILRCISNAFAELYFTFHYGSIQIIRRFYKSIILFSLHSTMVLFKYSFIFASLH